MGCTRRTGWFSHRLPIPGRDRVLALWEAGSPHALDMETLHTVGVDSLDERIVPGPPGALPLDLPLPFTGDAVSAHYAACATTERTVAWSWRRPAVGDDLYVRLHELDDEHGRASSAVKVSTRREFVLVLYSRTR